MSTTSILKSHIKPRIRKSLDNNQILIYNPSQDEKSEIKAILEKTAQLTTNPEGQLTLQANFEVDLFRFLIKTLTNLSSEIESLTDEEVIQIVENGDEIIIELLKTLKEIVKEISQEYIENVKDQLDNICAVFEQEESLAKLDQLLKSKNLNLQDLMALSQAEQELQKQFPKQPQDHKKETKKRGRKKKVVEESTVKETVDSVVEEVK